jgi:predicted nucleic acid-binding protein
MKDRSFLDTNILVYADDQDAGKKRDRARGLVRDLMRASCAVVSTQVLQEFFVITTKKLGVPAAMARRKVELLARMDVVVVRPELILGAIDLHRLHSISFWDALIVRAAVASGCARILSEDLSHGQLFEGVSIENPFLA